MAVNTIREVMPQGRKIRHERGHRGFVYWRPFATSTFASMVLAVTTGTSMNDLEELGG